MSHSLTVFGGGPLVWGADEDGDNEAWVQAHALALEAEEEEDRERRRQAAEQLARDMAGLQEIMTDLAEAADVRPVLCGALVRCSANLALMGPCSVCMHHLV